MKQAYTTENEQDQRGFISSLFSKRDNSETIDLYKQAAALGSVEAQAKVDELKARIR